MSAPRERAAATAGRQSSHTEKQGKKLQLVDKVGSETRRVLTHVAHLLHVACLYELSQSDICVKASSSCWDRNSRMHL